MSPRDDCSAGARPNTRPAPSDSARATTTNRISKRRFKSASGMPPGKRVRAEQVHDPRRRQQRDAAGHHREHEALGQQQPYDAAATRADGQPDRELTSPARHPDHHQIGDVGARHQQRDADDACEQREEACEIASIVASGSGCTGRREPDANRILLPKSRFARRDHVQLRLRFHNDTPSARRATTSTHPQLRASRSRRR